MQGSGRTTATTVDRSSRERSLGIGVLSVALAIWGQQLVAGHEFVFDGVLLYAIALVLAARTFELPGGTAPAEDWPGAAASCPSAVRRWKIDRPTTVVGGFALAANLAALRLFADNSNPSAAWVLYGASVMASPLAVWFATGRQRPRIKGWDLNEAAALAVVLAVAAAFRLFRIDSLPFGLWWDEAYSGLQVLRIMSEPTYRPLYVAGMAQEPALFWYLAVPFFRLFGPSALALRLTAVVGGLVGVVGVFLLARELAGRRVGIVAAFLLAVMAWHVNFSRIAFNCIWSVALDALAAYCLLFGMRTGKPLAFALGGVALGLGGNMYYTSRIVPAVLLIYLVHRMAVERLQFFHRHLGGLLLFAAMTLITVSPLLQFAYLHPSEFFARTDQVSVLREVVQSHCYTPLIDNVRKHLSMFLYQGDSNGRHNLPNAPMLDQVTGALVVLGLLMALRKVRQAHYFFLLVWGVLMLSGGVFSLAFEAPQSLRTIDEVTSVAILAALPVAAIWHRLDAFRPGEISLRLVSSRGGHSVLSLPLTALPIVGLLIGVAAVNYDRYFVRQASDYEVWSAFSTAETIIGTQIKQLGAEFDVYLGETFTGHPTIEFLSGRKKLPAFAPAEQLPLVETKNAAIFLEPDRAQSVALLRQLYPQAKVQDYRSPAGDRTVLYGVTVSQSEIAALQGLTGSYYADVSGTGGPIVTERLPYPTTEWRTPGLPTRPFLAIWQGTLSAPDYGPYRFRLEGPPSAELWIDGTRLDASGDGHEVVLAKGNHALQVKTVVTEPTPMRLLWKTPTAPQMALIPRDRLFSPPASNHGLLGSYYPNRDWSGSPAFQRVDPFLDMRVHLLPLPRPYSVEWRGKIDAPRSGLYRFATDSADASWVYLDDQLVVTNDGAPRQGREGSIRLEAGFHDLRVRFRDETGHTFIQVYWTPPDGNRELLPTDRLHPPQGSYPPPLQLPVAQTPPAQARAPARLQSGSVKLEYAGSIGAGSLGDPRDVAVSADGHAYVVDTAAKRVVIFNPDGSPAGQLAGDFAQPFGVAVSPDGKVTVLDSLGQDPVLRFGPQGELLSRLGGSAGCYSPRGLFVDSAGSVYLADTGRGRILKLDASGRVAGQFRGGGRLAQPVSVAVDPNGVLYVVDGEKQELMVIAPDDTFRRSWLISPATTFDAVHLTLGPKGEIYVSDPNGGTIMIYDAQGNVIGQVGTRGSGEGQFSLPTGVQVDAQGRLWVADTRNKRVQQWAIR